MRFFKYFSMVALIIVGIIFWQNHHLGYQTLSGKVFGTYYNIKVRTPNEIENFKPQIIQEFALVNNQMSIFAKDSEINKINQTSHNQWLEISPELYLVLNTSKEIYTQSSGAFDPSVGPLVNLWGFGVDGRQNIPSDQQIKDVLNHIGFNKLKFKEPNLIKKTDDKVYIDLSAIAKGYAVDLIASRLKQMGYNDFLVDIGGEVYASGDRVNGGQGWNIGIAEPSETGHKNVMAIGLKDMAVATSGNYNNFYYINNKRFSHTISPQTGYPAEHNLLSATVFDKSCMKADAYATAIMSMGEKKGLAFANKYKLAVIFFVKDGNNKVKSIYSKVAKQLIGE